MDTVNVTEEVTVWPDSCINERDDGALWMVGKRKERDAACTRREPRKRHDSSWYGRNWHQLSPEQTANNSQKSAFFMGNRGNGNTSRDKVETGQSPNVQLREVLTRKGVQEGRW